MRLIRVPRGGARSGQSELAQAEGQLAQANSQLLEANSQVLRADANQGKTQLDVNRYTPLAKEKAITEQELDNAVQANLAAKAEVAAARARVETAKAAIVAAKAAIEAAKAAAATAELNLGFTRIVSPIDGIAGMARAQVGNLVSATGDSLTTVSTVDPIKAYFTVTEREYLQYVRTNPSESQRQAIEREIELELVLADGSVYPRKGKFFVADREVNVQTGTIRLAGLFANPGNILRPGQYGRIRAVTEIRKGALLVPQRAVTELQGNYQVAVVGSDNKVSIRTVKVGERSGSKWIIEDGLNPGERVVAEGIQKVRPDMVVNPKPFVEPSADQRNRRGSSHDFQLLHQATDCGDGDRDPHRHRRSHRDAGAAPGAVSRDCAAADHRLYDVHWSGRRHD